MAAATTTRLVTADELMRMPDNPEGVRYELVRGKLILMSPSSVRSNVIAIDIARRLGNYVDERALGVVGGSEGGFQLSTEPDTVRAPDVWFLAAARIPPDGIPDSYFPGAPDMAIEVLSPSDRPAKVWQRVGDYLNAGSRLVFVLDPKTGGAVAFPPDGLPVIIPPDGTLDCTSVVPGFILPLNEVLRR